MWPARSSPACRPRRRWQAPSTCPTRARATAACLPSFCARVFRAVACSLCSTPAWTDWAAAPPAWCCKAKRSCAAMMPWCCARAWHQPRCCLRWAWTCPWRPCMATPSVPRCANPPTPRAPAWWMRVSRYPSPAWASVCALPVALNWPGPMPSTTPPHCSACTAR